MSTKSGHGKTVYACGHLAWQCRCINGHHAIHHLRDVCQECAVPVKRPPAPIMIPCEGSGCPGNKLGMLGLGCQMCGKWFLESGDVIPPHDRKDVMAMIARGDFGRPLPK